METRRTPFEALKMAVEIAGSQSAFARLCGVSQPAVWKWLQSAKRLPAEQVLKVEAATSISRHALRPDIYPLNIPLVADTSDVACEQNSTLKRTDGANEA